VNIIIIRTEKKLNKRKRRNQRNQQIKHKRKRFSGAVQTDTKDEAEHDKAAQKGNGGRERTREQRYPERRGQMGMANDKRHRPDYAA